MALVRAEAASYTIRMDSYLLIIGLVLLLSVGVVLLLATWPESLRPRSSHVDQEETDSHWHFDDSDGVSGHARL